MKEFVSILLIGISLSMDTFSLSLSLGSLVTGNKYLNLFPFLVGIFHFFMPLLGNLIGVQIIQAFNVASNILLGLILIFLGINLAIHYFKDEKVKVNLNFISTIFLAFSVSIDSFSVGIGLSNITSNFILSSLVFCFCSFSFTTMGIIIGKYSDKVIGKYANLLGILLLLVLGVYHLI